jgi:lipopolysaccharide export system protein LptA
MRALLLCLFLAADILAQQKELTFQQVTGGAFSGFTEDEKAEKAWEVTAKAMRPAAEAGVWDMDQLKVQSFRQGKPQAVFTSPYGTMNPARRAAQGAASVLAESPAFNLTGNGWSWRSTTQGDSFAILANVVAVLDLSKPSALRLRLRAPRLDASPVPGGTLMVFDGGVVAERQGERTTCERLECVVGDGPGGDSMVRTLVASGKVVRSSGTQVLRGDSAKFDVKDDSVDVVGHVEIEEPEVKGAAQRLRHEARLGFTQLYSGDGVPVRLHVARKKEDPADISGERVSIRRDSKAGTSVVEVHDNASYTSPQGHLTARHLVATEQPAAPGILAADGAVRGELEGSVFEAGKAQWSRALRLLELENLPRIRESRGLEAAGSAIRIDRLKDRIEIRSGPGVRAAIRLPAGEEAGLPGLAEANQVVVVTEDGAMQVELLGAVHYVAGPVTTDSEVMVAFATPRAKQRAQYELSKAILTGKVRYAQPGFRCSAERIDLTPAVQIEEVLEKDALRGRPRLLTLSGGAAETRPRLFVTYANGKSAEFISDADEILTTPMLTKFFLRGSVAMTSEGTDATCDLLEGLATPDKAGRQVARRMIGRGNVQVVAAGSSAKGRTLEVLPENGTARLLGDARITDKSGKEGVPAKEVTYDLAHKLWRMESAPDEANPGQVVRPKIFLGHDFTLPEVKSLDKAR